MASKDGSVPPGPRSKAEAFGVLKAEMVHLEPEDRRGVQALFNMRTQPAEVQNGKIIQPKKPNKGGRKSRRGSRRTRRR